MTPILIVLLAIAVTLLLLDIWVATEVLSHVALLILAGCFASYFEVSMEWRVAGFIFAYLVVLCAYYLFWKQIASHFANTLVAPTRHVDPNTAMIGRYGKLINVQGKLFIDVDGTLLPTNGSENYAEGASVKIENVTDGVVTLV